MLRPTSSRNQRSEGFKVKHVLQIALLLAVCTWLLYQVKHSHDKKKAFDENIAKLSVNAEDKHRILSLGRKDLKNDPEIASDNEKHSEEEEVEEEEESKREDNGDEGRGVIDGEIDEHDQEKAEDDFEHEDELVDEERENDEEGEKGEEVENGEEEDNGEERENEGNEGEEHKEEKFEDVGSLETQDHDNGGGGKSQDAHEEHYIKDNASDGVSRYTQMRRYEAGNGDSDNSNEDLVESSEKNGSERNKNGNSDNPNQELVENSEKTSLERDKNDDSDNPNHELVENSEKTSLERDNNGDSDNPNQESAKNSEKTNAGKNKSNITEMIVEQNGYSENFTWSPVGLGDLGADDNSAVNSTFNEKDKGLGVSLSKTEDGSATDPIITELNQKGTNNNSTSQSVEVPGSFEKNGRSVSGLSHDGNVTSEVEISKKDDWQNDLLEQTRKTNTTSVVVESDENSAILTVNENVEAVHSEPMDSSNSLVISEVKEALTVLETLPQAETEEKNTEVSLE